MDVDALRAELAGTRFGEIEWVAQTGSTNADLLGAVARGAPGGAVRIADHQVAGRGRLDRRWEAPPGSALLCSVLLRPTSPPGNWHLLTTALACAALDALEEVAAYRAALKWPNDLVVGPGDTRKLGGILAEAAQGAVVLGIGVNVTLGDGLPDHLRSIAASLDAVVGRVVDRGVLAATLLRRFDGRLVSLETEPERAAAALLDEYRRCCVTLGARVRIELGTPDGAVLEGEAVEIDPDGRLVVEEGRGRRHAVAVGDVVHVRGVQLAAPRRAGGHA